MKILLAAIALAIALPSAAHAQAQVLAKNAQMKPMCACCKDMMSGAGYVPRSSGGQQGMGAGHAGHAGHDMSQQSAKAPPADTHQNHKR